MVRFFLCPWKVLDVLDLPEFLSAFVTVCSSVAPVGTVAAVAADVGGAGVAAVASLQCRL